MFYQSLKCVVALNIVKIELFENVRIQIIGSVS